MSKGNQGMPRGVRNFLIMLLVVAACCGGAFLAGRLGSR